MIKLLFLLCSILLLALLPACRTIPPEARVTDNEEMDISKEIMIGETILKGLQDNDFRILKPLLENGPMKSVVEKDFKSSEENMKQQFGELKSYSYLAELQTPMVRNLIWKVKFERKGSSGKMIGQEILFRLVTGSSDGKTVVLGFGFF